MLSRLLFPQEPTRASVRYIFAFGCCAIAFTCRLLLDPLLQDHSPLLLFALAVAIAAIRGGVGPGVFATALGSWAALYFFPPMGTFFWLAPEYRATAVFQLATFFIAGVVLSWVGGELRRLRWQAVELAQERNEILESITDGFEALDNEGRFVYLNDSARQLLKHPAHDVIGKTIWEAIPDFLGTPVEATLRAVLQKRSAAHFEHFVERCNRWFEFHVHPAAKGGLTLYFSDISDRKVAELRLRETLAERDAALENVRVLSGLLPICAGCKKIRDNTGDWQQMESYISQHSDAVFSHGMCPDCARRYYGDIAAWSGG
jgi:PAS domain S-box-containing protein